MAVYVAFLRAVNVGRRRVAMATACDVLTELGLADVRSYANTGNLIFAGSGAPPLEFERAIRAALEDRFGFELTTFVRTARQVREFVDARPFGAIAAGHTYFGLLTQTKLTPGRRRAVEALSNDRDEVVARGRDVHWLIRAKSTETSLGPKRWLEALPGISTTARNMTLLNRLARTLP